MAYLKIVRVRLGFHDDEVIVRYRPLNGEQEDFTTVPIIDHPTEGQIIERDQLDQFRRQAVRPILTSGGPPR